ncbi:hypothetical protein I4U23_016418 [Adineta vaga]|nr:hypothetical protein I4U23_016418 [Adineta vaga]
MSSFKDRVDSALKSYTFIGNEVYREYAVSSVGQEVAFVVTTTWWYALRTFFDESHTNGNICHFHRTDHLTLDGTKDQINKYKEQLSQQPPFFQCDGHNSTREVVCPHCAHHVTMPKECSNNPDVFLKPGDHVSVSRGLYHHDCIYAGNRTVYHISSGEGDSKTAKSTTCVKFQPWEKFTLNKDGKIKVIVYRIRRRTPTQILNAAKEYADSSYGAGVYHFTKKNCQHFAGNCCTGFDWSHEGATQFAEPIQFHP